MKEDGVVDNLQNRWEGSIGAIKGDIMKRGAIKQEVNRSTKDGRGKADFNWGLRKGKC